MGVSTLPKRMLKAVLPERVTRLVQVVRRVYASPRAYELCFNPWKYYEDGLAGLHNCDFMADPRFRDAYERGKATGSWNNWDIRWRAYVACWCAAKAAKLPGDFVECGVNKGGLSLAIMTYLHFERMADKKFYLLDTYQGLVTGLVSEAELARGIGRYVYEDCYDQVKATFAPYRNAVLVRGVVPDTLAQVPAKQVAYLSVDMNCAAPEVAAATFFWDRLVPGGVILLDDYGFDPHVAQKEAFDRFAAERDVQVLCLPTGQGLIFKP